ncbi:thiamine ABC transporter substrate-binding protein [Chloroflexi bacterium TSY]|nr:thiamine ABC transporter substrate-binding protein [Chloroflexi bacterium TSY]
MRQNIVAWKYFVPLAREAGQTKTFPGRHTFIPVLLLVLLLGAACQPIAVQPAGVAPSSEEPTTLILASHGSFSISEEVLAQFEGEHNVTLQLLELGDAGEALNRLILSKDAPLADVFYGVDNTFLSRALEADIFESYDSPMLEQISDDLKLDAENRLLPVNFGFVTINADKEWFAESGLAIPQTLDDLTNPDYKGLLVVENPATSSPGLAFLLTTVAYFGEDGYLDFWQALRENDVLITQGWSEAYFEHFTVGSGGGGARPLVVTYSTSPPADVVFAEDGRTEPASVNVSPPEGTFRQIEFVGVLKGAQNPEMGRALVDFMLGKSFQEDIPLQMFVYPANVDAGLPDVFVEFGQTPDTPAVVDPAAIEANRETWTTEWTEIMLR